jgi:hypothetical protein
MRLLVAIAHHRGVKGLHYHHPFIQQVLLVLQDPSKITHHHVIDPLTLTK